jgi:hypothetical protein
VDLIRAGSSLFLLRTGSVSTPHLWAILTDPVEGGRVVGVMLVTDRSHTDKTTCLEPGDHEFVKTRTSVDYGTARFFSLNSIEGLLSDGRGRFERAFSPEVLQRIQQGLLRSPRTVHFIKEFCRSRFA